jgi:V8-like Glu-specific endopeptidase
MRAKLLTTARRLGAGTIQQTQSRPAVALAALAATATLSASLASAPFAQASVASAQPGVTGHHVETSGPSLAYSAQVDKHWTRSALLHARNADVIPTPLPPSKPRHIKNPQALPQQPRNAGQPGRVAGAAPTELPAGGIRPGAGAHRAIADDSPYGNQWYGSSTQPPATTTGRVYFTTTGNGQTENWWCTASTVNSNGKDAVITAGHCVYGSMGGKVPGETWHSNWVFMPGYSNGYAPYGFWTARQLWTLNNYINNGGSAADEGDDIGAAVMNTNSSGQHIVNVVGGQGITWDYPDNLYVYDFSYGYGSVLDYCNSSEFDWSSNQPSTMGLNCDFPTDGGPWLAFFNGETGYVNGVNDFSYSNLPNYIFSAYFGNNAGNLYNSVAGL